MNGLTAGSGGPSPSGDWGTGTTSNFGADSGGLNAAYISTSSLTAVHFSAGTDATGAYNVRLTGAREAADLVFEEGAVSLDPHDSADRLNIAGGATLTNNSAHQAFIKVNVIGTTSLSIAGPGDLYLSQVANPTSSLTLTVGATGDGSSRTVTLGNTSGIGNDSSNTHLAVIANSGTLLLNRDIPGNAAPDGITVNNSGTMLSGVGTIGATSVNAQAVISPGLSNTAIGTLTTGNLTLASTSIFKVDIAQPTSFDQLIVNGAASIGGATLSVAVLSGLTFSAGQRLTLILNESDDAINGTFAGLSQGGTVTANGYSFTANYFGGNGNDFDLIAVPEPSTWVAGIMAIAAIVLSQRQRFAGLHRFL